MKLTILGSGTFIPTGNRNTASYLVETSKAKILFDMGRGSIGQLYKEGHSLKDLDAIFITHTHQDHCSELVPFIEAVMGNHSPKELINPNLVIYGPKGLKKTIRRIYKAFGITYKKENLRPIIELKDGEDIKKKGFTVKAYKVCHHPKKKSFSYRLEADKKTFMYSGDTTYCENVILASKNADIALLEATSPELRVVHLDGELAGKIAREAKVKQLVLTHIKLDYLESKQVLKDAKKEFKGKIQIAKDGMKINF